MSHITVDPEMKSRVMSAVSAAIKENPDGAAIVTDIPESPKAEAPVKKKAKKTPIAIISSIAAAILVLLGVLFVFNMMNGEKKQSSTSSRGGHEFEMDSYFGGAAEDTVADHNDEAELDDEISKVVEDTTAESAEGTEDRNYSLETKDTYGEIDINNNYYTILPTTAKLTSE